MRPRAQVRWLQLKVGLVIIAAVAGILVAIMNLNEGMGLFRQQATFRALVDDSHGIKVGAPVRLNGVDTGDRKSTRLNSSHSQISYAVFCLKKKKKTTQRITDSSNILTT